MNLNQVHFRSITYFLRRLPPLLLTLACTTTLIAQPQSPADTPRDLLRIMQIDDSLLGQFIDDRPVEPDEREPLLRLLFRLPSFSQVDIERWTKPLAETKSLAAICSDHRFEFVEVRGVVERIELQTIIPELVERLGFSNYYRLTISHGTRVSLVFVRKLPTSWEANLRAGKEIREPVRVQGLLLKKQQLGEKTGLVLAASQIHWFPQVPSKDLQTTNDMILLADLGVDIGPLADVRQRSTMRAEDRESFYQILAAVHHAEMTQFDKLARRQFDMGRMIQKPESVVSELYSVEGTARRAIRIEVQDTDIQARFGLDHYFEVEVFVPMKRSIRFVNEADEARIFRDYPFVFCVPELPDDMPLGDDIRVQVQATGFFLKLWSYRTEFMSHVRTREDRPAQQVSPLLIGPTVTPSRTDPSKESSLSLIIAILFVLSLFVVWILLWRAGIQDRRRAQQLFAKNLPSDTSFHDLQGS